MVKKIDISGQKFGMLFALDYSHTENKRRFYNCLCDCGIYTKVARKLLVRGDTKSCGCQWRLSNKKHSSWRGFGDIPMDFYSNAKRGAKSRNIDFDITIEYLWELLLKQGYKCALSGLDLQFGEKRKDNQNKSISLDRIDSSVGYICGNVQFIHKHINIIKNKFNESYFIELCKHITNENKIKNMKENKNKWSKITHIKSSMISKDSQYALFIGRWQSPNGLHDGHKALFNQVLNEGNRVCIAIRDVEPDEKNPFTSQQVFDNISKFYMNNILLGQIKVIIIPDISSVEFGRGVGYDIIEHIPPSEISDISATKIREEMRKKGEL